MLQSQLLRLQRGPEPTNAGGFRKPGKKGKGQGLLKSLQRNQPCLHPDFTKTHMGPLTSKQWDNKFVVFVTAARGP